jgi:hypothetical protein
MSNPAPVEISFMLSSGSILRRLPATVPLKERLNLEAMVFASDLLALAFHTIKRILLHYGTNIEKISEVDRSLLFLNVWTIVDQLHVLRQLVDKRRMGPTTKKFYDDFESATLLRHRMDHLHRQIGNIANQKGRRPPIFGSLSFFLVTADEDGTSLRDKVVRQGLIVTITSGTAPTGKASLPAPNPAGKSIDSPIGLFSFTAFDQTLDLEGGVIAAHAWMCGISEDIENQIRQQVSPENLPSGMTVEQAMAPAPMRNMVVTMTVKFKPDGNPADRDGFRAEEGEN